jgi:hypothetical protein
LPSVTRENYKETGAPNKALSFGCIDLAKAERLKQISKDLIALVLGRLSEARAIFLNKK